MRRTGVVLASVVLALAGLAACSSADKEYCDKVKEMGSDFLAASPTGGDSKAAEQYQAIADVAPSEIKGDWQKMADFMKAFKEDPAAAAGQAGGVQTAASNVSKDIQDRCS